jgi:hypothetical protein
MESLEERGLYSSNFCEDYLKDLGKSLKGFEDSSSQKNSKKNTTIKLLQSILQSNIPIACQYCDDKGVEGKARAFIRGNPLKIVLCYNRLQRKDYEEALVHEATHAFDYLAQNCNFSTCEGLAYSEVRAARNAECASSMWLTKKWCTKDYAIKSTANLFPDSARYCVNRVIDVAYEDERPN